MMNNQIMFSKGLEISNINGNINKKEYEAIYDGKKRKMVLNNNGEMYYIEANDKDVENIFKQTSSDRKIDEKLKLLLKNKKLKNKRKPKSIKKRKRKNNKTKKIRIIKTKKNIPRKKIKIIKTKTPSKKSKSKKSKSRKKKSPSKKKTIQRLLSDDLLKTII